MDISVIIVSYNTKDLTRECINSIIKNTKGIDYEIIVVDNASKDASVEVLKKLKQGKTQKIKIIENKNNKGFGGANNQGIKRAGGKYILLLNSDTVIHDNIIGEMASWMNKRKSIGIAGCSLKNKDGSMQGTG